MDNSKRESARIGHSRVILLGLTLLVTAGLLTACGIVDRVTGGNTDSAALDAHQKGSHDGGSTRTVCKFANDTLEEISGLAASIKHPGILWAHNDSGDGPRIYAVSNTSCEIQATITLGGVDPRDVEAIAMGRNSDGDPVIWVGDIGDNLGTWTNVRLYRIPEPNSIKNQTIQAKTYNLTYADGPRDAEGLLVDPRPGGRIWITTKRMAADGGLYALPKSFISDGFGTAKRVGSVPPMTTDASFAPDGKSFVIRTYLGAELFQGVPPGTDGQTIGLPLQTQGEAITFSSAGTGLYAASEGEASLWFVPLD